MPAAYLLEWRRSSGKQYKLLSTGLKACFPNHLEEMLFTPEGIPGRVILLLAWDRPEASEIFFRTRLQQIYLLAGLETPLVKTWSLDGKPTLSLGWTRDTRKNITDNQ